MFKLKIQNWVILIRDNSLVDSKLKTTDFNLKWQMTEQMSKLLKIQSLTLTLT